MPAGALSKCRGWRRLVHGVPRVRTAGEDSESDGGAVAVADGFQAPLFGLRVVGQVTTLPLKDEDTFWHRSNHSASQAITRAPGTSPLLTSAARFHGRARAQRGNLGR